MIISKKLKMLSIICIMGVIVFSGCGSEEPNPETKGGAPPLQPAPKESVVKKVEFNITPLHSEVYSKDEQVRATISDVLDIDKIGIASEDLLDYSIYLYVHPLNSDGWWRQNPVPPTTEWTAQAYLGGLGQYSAKDGEKFQIIAVLSKQPPPEKVKQIRLLREIENLYFISELRTMTVRR
jgi:hypothetical protein